MSSTGPTTNNNNNNSSNATEQPQTKRQKIEKIQTAATATTTLPPPDILDTGGVSDQSPASISNGSSNLLCSSSLSSSANSISTTPSSNSPTSTPCSSRANSYAQLLNVQNIVNSLPITSSGKVLSVVATVSSLNSSCHNSSGGSSSAPESGSSSGGEQSADEVDRITLPDILSPSSNAATLISRIKLPPPAVETSSAQDMREFEESLTKQCLCGVSERTLRKPFQSHYSLDMNGQKRIANLSEWPTNKLLQFLSNVQLLFDIYLKQNSKGFICARIMDVCDALIRNDHNLVDEIIVLAGYNNGYVQFLAGRVLASFLVIAKQNMNDDWLKKLVDNLFNFKRLDHVAVQKIHFSLEIIKLIVDWKDVDLHPLEDEIVDTQQHQHHVQAHAVEMSLGGASTSSASLEPAYLHFQTHQPTLENNYFAVHFRDNAPDALEQAHEAQEQRQAQLAELPPHLLHAAAADYVHFEAASSTAATATLHTTHCHIITLTDSESFDTTNLKCITVKILENKWPALVNNMSALIANHLSIENAENCILNFLQLWENIITVRNNLSIVETRPFHAQLDNFELLLLNPNLSCTVYKQMLCLFNEALCYGSTLALQDMLPDETCRLSHLIVRQVKDSSILESLPRRQPENVVSLIGFKRAPLHYAHGSLQPATAAGGGTSQHGLPLGDVIEMDKTILQKMVLLVLKSIAVTVKEIRNDSSDSSIDSSDFDAVQDLLVIELSIRAVLRKLESFIKHTLEFHPECHFSKILIHLFDDQDDHLVEAMVCTLDVTSGISFRNNEFPELVALLNPVFTFLEFLKMISYNSELLLDLLVSNETCFLLYLLRFLKYIRMNWSMFVQSCHDFGMGTNTLNDAMTVLIRLRMQISRLVSKQLYPYDISPILRLLESCESLYEGNELS